MARAGTLKEGDLLLCVRCRGKADEGHRTGDQFRGFHERSRSRGWPKVRLASWAYKQTSGQHDLFHERVSNPLCGRMLGMGPPNKIGAINAEFRCFGTTENLCGL